jgi:hypothetical protein
MAAFCSCCGAEIKPKVEACMICGTPRHGMMPPDRQPTLDPGEDAAQKDIGPDGTLRKARL